ncbi:uncharacterized protein LOC141655411 [Silene latifolia]|uniref:uncharacterized protein LOC141655411 n=1 Tax=Silene latifolia TaxID=37657 RepID=UPI003D783C9A
MGRPKKLVVTVLQPRRGRSETEDQISTPIAKPNSVNSLIVSALEKSGGKSLSGKTIGVAKSTPNVRTSGSKVVSSTKDGQSSTPVVIAATVVGEPVVEAPVPKPTSVTQGAVPIETVPSVAGKTRWVDKVTNSAVGMELHSVPDACSSGVVVIEVEDIQSQLVYWQNTLVGQFIGGKPAIAQVKEFVKKQWTHVSPPDVLYFKKDWFYFRFTKLEDMHTILRGNAWNLNGHSLILKQWTPQFPTELDKISKGRLSFALVMVEVDLAQPLPDFVAIHTPFLGQILQGVEYEWLPFYCTHCKKLGHEEKVCKLKKKETNQSQGEQIKDSGKLTVEEPTVIILDKDVLVPNVTKEVGDIGAPEGKWWLQCLMGVVSQFALLEVRNVESAIIPDSKDSHRAQLVVTQIQVPARSWAEQEDFSIMVTVQQSTSQWIHLLVTKGALSMYLTFVYGFNHPSQRLPLWEFMVEHHQSNMPWLLLGDFNCVRTLEERISSDPPNLVALVEFNDVISHAGLVELNTQGCWYTWTNKQEHDDCKWMRLDRALVNSSWLLTYPDSNAEVLTPGISDHSPLVVNLGVRTQVKKASFQYLNCWGQDRLFLPLVQKEWHKFIRGCPMYRLTQHLHGIKNQLRRIHKDSYSNITERVAKLKHDLQLCQQRVHSDPTNMAFHEEEELCNKAYFTLRNTELNIAYQRAKDFDIKQGDAGTAYFYSRVASRRNTANISKVMDIHG